MRINAKFKHRARYTGEKITKTFFTRLQFCGALNHCILKIFFERQDFCFYRFTLSDIAKYTVCRNGHIIYRIETHIAFHHNNLPIFCQKWHFNESNILTRHDPLHEFLAMHMMIGMNDVKDIQRCHFFHRIAKHFTPGTIDKEKMSIQRNTLNQISDTVEQFTQLPLAQDVSKRHRYITVRKILWGYIIVTHAMDLEIITVGRNKVRFSFGNTTQGT